MTVNHDVVGSGPTGRFFLQNTLAQSVKRHLGRWRSPVQSRQVALNNSMNNEVN